jgi:hypothetical protein
MWQITFALWRSLTPDVTTSIRQISGDHLAHALALCSMLIPAAGKPSSILRPPG